MQGSGVNTYKWVNADGEAVLVKYHWEPQKQGIRNLTQPEAETIQSKNFNHATQDLYEAIEKGDYPEWELCVQIMSDDEYPKLDFDPIGRYQTLAARAVSVYAGRQNDFKLQSGRLL